MENFAWVMFALIVIAAILWIWAILDIVGGGLRGDTSKLLWLVVVIIFPILGVILYYFFGRSSRPVSGRTPL